MIDRDALRRYDAFFSSAPMADLALEDRRAAGGRRVKILPATDRCPEADMRCRVVVAGGGPAGMLYGYWLSRILRPDDRTDFTVVVLEKRGGGRIERTWNLTRAELFELTRGGLFTREQIERCVAGEFEEGLFAIHDRRALPGRQREYHYDSLLNVSVDQERFFGLFEPDGAALSVRRSSEATLVCTSADGVYVRAREPGEEHVIRAELFVDARGMLSPLARLVHREWPMDAAFTVIGLRCEGLDPLVNPVTGRTTGIILATCQDEIVLDGRHLQPIVERFTENASGHQRDIILYFTLTPEPLKTADLADELAASARLLAPEFDESCVDRTYYGHIPYYADPAAVPLGVFQYSAGDRILFIGDAAGYACGLTGCGFGAIVRNAAKVCPRIARSVESGRLRFDQLQRIDIDPRERASQRAENLFGGVMMLQPGESPGTVNRDWITFCSMADHLPQRLRCLAFRDEMRLSTLDRLLTLCSHDRASIAALLRNNDWQVGRIVRVFLAVYAHLLMTEFGYAFSRRRLTYALNALGALGRLPGVLLRSAELALRAWARRRHTRIPSGPDHMVA